MSLIVADRVQETTNTTGTGAYVLGGASPGFQAFSVVTSNADTVYYSVTDNVDFEVGLGTYASSGNLISRTTVFSSSNSNNAVNWGVGTKNIFLTYPADKAVIEDVSNNVTIGNNLVVGGTVDGVDIQTLNTTANAALPKAGGTMTGDLILNADPTAALQSATKQYVDTIAAAGIHYHQACRAETTANLNATYSNGSSGVGATLTNAGTQAAIVVDDVTLVATDRVMVQDQTNTAHNGVYTVTTVGSGSTNWVLTRATDADSYSPSDPDALGEGDAFFITEGTVHGGELDVMTTSGVITFGTTGIVFALVSDAPIYTAGTGLSISGTEFSLVTPVTSATALATARTIGMTGDVVWTSAAFDGTGNVTGTATIQANSVALGTDTTGSYVGAGATSGTGLSGSLSGEGGTFTVTSNATNANTASTIVARDGSGNFSAGTITGALTGNADTATALATGRTIGMTGDVVWTSASFDGSGNVTGTATIQANSVALGTDTTGNYVSSIANGSYLTGGGSASENKAYTLGVDATSANTASKVVSRDGNGHFSAGTVTASLSGNASTATTLQTARTIGGVSFNGSASINLPGVNTSGNQATSGNAATATALQTARTINGVSFNGTSNITVADSTKLPLAGGTITGNVNLTAGDELLVGGTFANNAYNSNASSTIYLGGGSDRANYSIGTSLENVGGNYTKLDLKWHTGIRMFAMPQYGGLRYFTNNAMSTQIFSIGQGDSHVRVANNLYVGDTVHIGSQVSLSESTDRADLLQITSATSDWAGLQIRNSSNEGLWSFMTNGSEAGIYDDENNEWAMTANENGSTYLYHNGVNSLQTVSNGIRVGSSTSSDIYMQDTDQGERRIHCNSNQIGFLNSSSNWSAYSTDAGLWACANGLAVTGNISVTGAVDGRDVAADGAKLDTIATSANNYSFPYTVSASESASTVVQRTGSGYLHASYFNGTGTFSTTGNTSGMARFTGTNGGDTYGRSYTAAAARTLLNVADGANNITNNNQLTNGAGYTTYTSNQATNSNSNVTFGQINCSDVYSTAWFRTTGAAGIYFASYTGGWNMTDSTWIRAYNNKSILTSGTMQAGTFNTTSDERIKKDITPITDAVSKVQQLGGYSFTFKDSGKKSSGVIAQEVQAVLPELVQEGGEGHLTVQYGNMVGLLIEAIKEQQAQIDALTAKLNG